MDTYLRSTKLKLLFILILVAVCTVSAFISLSTEAAGLSLGECLSYTWDNIVGNKYAVGSTDYIYSHFIWQYKVPRVLFAIIAGAGLAVAGVTMQSVMNNPLADPYTTGISSGACMGVSCVLVLGVSAAMHQSLLMIIGSFIFSMIPTVIILLVSPKAKTSPSTLILAGVALSYMFNAFSTLLLVSTDSETLATVYQWQVGSIAGVPWENIYISFIIVLVGCAISILLSRKLNVLALGENNATGLGLDTESLRVICLMIIGFIVATIVGSAGILGFVGLMSPHIVRMLVGSDNRFVIPAAIAFSASFLLVCDIISLKMDPLGGIPVGAVISIIGAPIFLYLIVRRNSNVW